MNSVLGVVLYPDGYTGSTYSGSDWDTFEAAGCVFLPAAGYRSGAGVSSEGDLGYYWLSTAVDAYSAYGLYFYGSYVFPVYYNGRCYGSSVRLVQNLN